jgi:hypothetical protein
MNYPKLVAEHWHRWVFTINFAGRKSIICATSSLGFLLVQNPRISQIWPFYLDPYLYLFGYGSIPIIPFLGGWTSIYQLFWCELQVYGVLTHPHIDALRPTTGESTGSSWCFDGPKCKVVKGIVWGPWCTGNPSSHVQLEPPKKIGHWQLEKAAPKGNSLDLRRWCWSSDGLHNPAETPKEPAMRGAIRVGWTVSVLIYIFEDTLALKTHEQYFKSPGVFFFPGLYCPSMVDHPHHHP